MDIQSLLIAGLTIFAVAGIGLVVIEPLLSGSAKAEKRQMEFSGNNSRKKIAEEGGNRKKQVADALKELDDRQKAQAKLTLEQKFVQAGLHWTRKTYIMISVCSGAIAAFIFMIASGQPVAAIAGLVIGGFGLPNWYLKRAAKKRQKAFLLDFPNAIDAIVRGIKSGLPLNDCIRLIATEAKEPVRGEFRTVVEAQQLGISVPEAIQKIFERIPTSEVNFFAIVIQIQAKSGGNLGEILSGLSRVIRDRKKLRDKVTAMSSEAKSSAAIIGSLPVIVGVLAYFGNPDYISLLWTTKSGQVAIGICIGMMTTGVLVMKKMINFEV